MRHVRKYKRLAKADSPMAGSTAQVKPPITKRARSVVDALFSHFEKWKPEVLEQGVRYANDTTETVRRD